ncbi:ATP-binding protein [Spiractinospora alimapuensis]|uniref:ATP-binding protein n=1 Tax=Spiractinospora alimapuensis TaxID=2820884 RepID=UPI001F350289|nr:ATP-binding protein [Spiractinospora alimapuensis]QVQ53284.1 ATP-binding protein [Spiractinospora alimapuensis]
MPLTPVAPLPTVTVPLNRFIPSGSAHYFNGDPDGPIYRKRRFEFCGLSAMMPLVRAFLNTCAAHRDPDYRYTFTLLGSELANNAIQHTLSGDPGGYFTLRADRSKSGITLTCTDSGTLRGTERWTRDVYFSLEVPPNAGEDPLAVSGRGLMLVDTLADSWGDNGRPYLRSVWFHLAY